MLFRPLVTAPALDSMFYPLTLCAIVFMIMIINQECKIKAK